MRPLMSRHFWRVDPAITLPRTKDIFDNELALTAIEIKLYYEAYLPSVVIYIKR